MDIVDIGLVNIVWILWVMWVSGIFLLWIFWSGGRNQSSGWAGGRNRSNAGGLTNRLQFLKVEPEKWQELDNLWAVYIANQNLVKF